MKRNILNKLCLIVFIFLSLFICIESLMPSNLSGAQSSFIATLIGGKKDQEIKPESLSITGNETMFVGDNQKLKIEFKPEKTSDTRVSWSLDSNIASISNDGTLIANQEGIVNVTATSVQNNELNASFSITINPVVPENISVDSNLKEISIGTTAKLNVAYNPTNTTYQNYRFFSSNPAVATIDEHGIIRGISLGTSECYVYDEKYKIESNHVLITINDHEVIPVKEITCEPIETIYLKQHVLVTPTFNSDASDKSYHLISKDESIVQVQNNYLIGRKVGTTTITIVSNYDSSKALSYEVSVEEIPARAIDVYDYLFTYGEPHKLEYKILSTIEGLEVTNKEVVFSSSNEEIATIDQNGNIYGKKIGSVTITVSWKKDPTISGSGTIRFESSSNTAWEHFKGIIRKLVGHFSLFLITGIFGYLTFRFIIKNKKKALLVNVSYGCGLGVISELLQLIPEGRACLVKDMFIDAGGYLLGTIIIILLICLYKLIKKKKRKTHTNEKDH